MKAPPVDWPRLSSCVFYLDAKKAIDWLAAAFGFELRLLVEGQGGRVEHSEMEYGGAVIMVGSAGAPAGGDAKPWAQNFASPKALGGRHTQSLMLYIDDADAHCARARAAGAEIVYAPQTTDYGADYWSDRSYGALDPEGHLWWFAERVSTRGVPHGA